MSVKAVVSSEGDRDVNLLLAASCLPLPEAVIGLLAAQNSRNFDLDSVPAEWSALAALVTVAVP